MRKKFRVTESKRDQMSWQAPVGSRPNTVKQMTTYQSSVTHRGFGNIATTRCDLAHSQVSEQCMYSFSLHKRMRHQHLWEHIHNQTGVCVRTQNCDTCSPVLYPMWYAGSSDFTRRNPWTMSTQLPVLWVGVGVGGSYLAAPCRVVRRTGRLVLFYSASSSTWLKKW